MSENFSDMLCFTFSVTVFPLLLIFLAIAADSAHSHILVGILLVIDFVGFLIHLTKFGITKKTKESQAYQEFVRKTSCSAIKRV